MQFSRDRYVCVSMHDVSPATWARCQRLLAALDEVAVVPATLLVVPAYHDGVMERPDSDFIRQMDDRLLKGDELALHGFNHLDPLPTHGLRQYIQRRVYTAGEGEFAALSADQARVLLERGVQWFAANNWPLHGFVAPAWLMSSGSWRALADYPFDYTTTLREMILLPERLPVQIPSLTYSTRSALRRLTAQSWNDFLFAITRDCVGIRLGLHPADANYPRVIDHWQRLLSAALESRQAVTKNTLAMHLRRQQQMPLRDDGELAGQWNAYKIQMEAQPIMAPTTAPANTSLG